MKLEKLVEIQNFLDDNIKKINMKSGIIKKDDFENLKKYIYQYNKVTDLTIEELKIQEFINSF